MINKLRNVSKEPGPVHIECLACGAIWRSGRGWCRVSSW